MPQIYAKLHALIFSVIQKIFSSWIKDIMDISEFWGIFFFYTDSFLSCLPLILSLYFQYRLILYWLNQLLFIWGIIYNVYYT